MNPMSSAHDAAWIAIEKERRRDRFVRRISVAAWMTTFVLLLAFAVIMVPHIVIAKKRAAVGMDPWFAVYDAALPLVAVVGVVSLLVATLSTVGIFLRLRTASLSEIQLRLANLEDMLRTDGQYAVRVTDAEAGQLGGKN
ncbi:MAG TPA: hypothetical protein VK636_19015 [Gemmatimonadaceae bacterium]|nr:hypothetical protein [Gemmatimonadaceae bacterium]